MKQKILILTFAFIGTILLLTVVFTQSTTIPPTTESSPTVEVSNVPAATLLPTEDASVTVEQSSPPVKSSVIEVPYVGMPESKISSTLLGAPSDVGSDMEVTYNSKKMVTIYYFFRNGKWIFCARCIDGSVVSVSDYRNSVNSSYTPKAKVQNESDDPYNASDYRNAEDFYEYHYYDFFDFYDAEKYYREHTR